MLIRKTRAGASRANLHPIHKSKRNWKEAPWSEIVQHSMIARLQIGQANYCRKLRWQRPWAYLEVRIEPPHNLAALKGAFGLENAITKDRFVATHFHLGIGNGGETQIKCPYPRFPWCGLRQWLEPRDRTGALSCDVLLSDLVVLIFVSLHLPWSVDQKCSRVQKSLTNRCGYRFHVSISAPWAPPLSTASNCISATSNALRSKQGSLIRPETLHQNGITIPPLLLQKSGAGVRVYLPWYIAMTY